MNLDTGIKEAKELNAKIIGVKIMHLPEKQIILLSDVTKVLFQSKSSCSFSRCQQQFKLGKKKELSLILGTGKEHKWATREKRFMGEG